MFDMDNLGMPRGGHQLAEFGVVASASTASLTQGAIATQVVRAIWTHARPTVRRVLLGAPLFAASAWLFFWLAFKLRFPLLEPDIPGSAVLQSWLIVGAGGAGSLLIAGPADCSVRNAALGGSIMAAAVSCMVFTSMSGMAAPSVLAYDLGSVVASMAGSATLAAAGLWLMGRSTTGRIAGAALIAGSLAVVAVLSLSSILPFSEWRLASTMPSSIAFRPVTAVFTSEVGVTLMLGLLGAGVDRQAAAQIGRENERLRQLAETTFEALLIHRAGVIVDANTAFCELIGRPLAAIKGRPVADIVPEYGGVLAPVTGKPKAVETEIIGSDGAVLPVEMLSREIPFAGGKARVTALRDIRERLAAEARIRFLAQHDPLTGLSNRAQFHEVIARELALSKRDRRPLAVFCIDLDRFKAVNDTLGHAAGDLLLQQVAERILGNVRECDTVARIGGDEFVLLQTSAAQPEASAQLAERLVQVLTAPFDLDGNRVTIGASIGIALAPQDSSEAAELVQKADIALYRAKSNGRAGHCFFHAGMDTLQRQRRELEQDIVQALATDGFRLVYQPLFPGDSAGGAIGFEALLRWPHPVRGPVPPDQFIPLAEETGLIIPLGTWVLKTACREAASWPMRCSIAVNVSARQLTGGDFVAVVTDVLRRTGLEPSRLEIEITETLLINDGQAALDILQGLKALGVRIVLDDFGTGYSSLSYLQRFPFDKVKIDRSFIHNLTNSESARTIVGAILAMSHQLHLEVTAEGVELEEELALLNSGSCDQIQGYLLSRPLPQHEVEDFLLGRVVAPSP
jgi:diguanylate cyclase (GGDEF)-like protein/PAS domain S-box-containing protein